MTEGFGDRYSEGVFSYLSDRLLGLTRLSVLGGSRRQWMWFTDCLHRWFHI